MRGYMVNNHLYNTTYFLICQQFLYKNVEKNKKIFNFTLKYYVNVYKIGKILNIQINLI